MSDACTITHFHSTAQTHWRISLTVSGAGCSSREPPPSLNQVSNSAPLNPEPNSTQRQPLDCAAATHTRSRQLLQRSSRRASHLSSWRLGLRTPSARCDVLSHELRVVHVLLLDPRRRSEGEVAQIQQSWLLSALSQTIRARQLSANLIMPSAVTRASQSLNCEARRLGPLARMHGTPSLAHSV